MTSNRIQQLYQAFLRSDGVATDTRSQVANKLFIALRGDQFNGNRFISTALDQGAKLVIGDDPAYCPDDDRCWFVHDTLDVLQELAAHHRMQIEAPVIAIAGSNGKTTTKELIISVLSAKWEVHGTKGNFNNHIGLPLTLLEAQDVGSIDIVVLEMGARQAGDIENLCQIGQPTHGLITNAGKDHLESFGSVNDVMRSNAELYRYLENEGGTAFINSDHSYLLDYAESIPTRIYYGSSEQNHCQGEIIDAFPYLRIQYSHQSITNTIYSHLPGHYNFENILAAVCVGHHFGVGEDQMAHAVREYQPSNYRSQIIHQGTNTIILDAYNANPTSMKEAIAFFNDIPATKKVAVLGDMLDLGAVSDKEHRDIVELLGDCSFDEVILVGQEFAKVSDQIDCHHFNSNHHLKKWLAKQHYEHTTFLVKASRGIALEEVFLHDNQANL